MNKAIQQRKKYINRKMMRLNDITDAHKYTRRLSRIMKYHKLLTSLEVAEIKRVLK